MKFKKLLGIFFFLALITTTVFGFSAENSRQGFDRNFTNLHQVVSLGKAALAPGSLACFLDSSRQAFLSGQGNNPDPNGWKNVPSGRPLEKMGHAQKHLSDFQKIDPNLTSGEVAKILEYVRRVGKIVPEAGEAGATVFESVVNIGGKNVVVRTVESASKVIKSGYPFIR